MTDGAYREMARVLDEGVGPLELSCRSVGPSGRFNKRRGGAAASIEGKEGWGSAHAHSLLALEADGR